MKPFSKENISILEIPVDEIQKQDYKSSGQAAKDSATFDKAVSERKETLCDQISLAEGAAKCREVVAAQKDSDLFNAAVEKGDPSLCSTLSSDEVKAQCAEVIEGLTKSNAPG